MAAMNLVKAIADTYVVDAFIPTSMGSGWTSTCVNKDRSFNFCKGSYEYFFKDELGYMEFNKTIRPSLVVEPKIPE